MAKLIESNLTKEVVDLVDTLIGMYDDYGYRSVNSILFIRLDNALKGNFPESRKSIVDNLADLIDTL